MSKEKELQDELERYWGQQDRIERMLKWTVIHLKMIERGQLAGMNYSPEATGKQVDELVGQLPDISDILNQGDTGGKND